MVTPMGMDQRLVQLLARQLAAGFADFRGADASITLPVSDRLVNELIAEWTPPSAPVRDVRVRSYADNRLAVQLRIAAAAFFPPVSFTLKVDRQPDLPSSPVLVLRMGMGGLLSMAGPALRFLNALPPGIRVDDDRVHVNLAELLEQRGLGSLLQALERLEITPSEGALVLTVRLAIRAPLRST
jgi:hypothetical protein